MDQPGMAEQEKNVQKQPQVILPQPAGQETGLEMKLQEES